MQNSITYYIEDNIFPSFKKVNGEKSNPSHSSSSSLNLNPNYLGFDSSILSRSVPKASLPVELSACNSSYFYPSFVGLPLTLEMPVTSKQSFYGPFLCMTKQSETGISHFIFYGCCL